MHRLTKLVVFALLLAGCSTPGADVSSFDEPDVELPPPGKELTTFPAYIHERGRYYLSSDAVFFGGYYQQAAVVIDADDVELDLNRHTISNGGANHTAAGVYVDHASRVTVHNGRIEGFHTGVRFADGLQPAGSGHAVRDLVVAGSSWRGIMLYGNDSVIERNDVRDTGGFTTTGTTYVHGISALGSSLRIADNEISGLTNLGVTGGKETVGIACERCPDAAIEDNTVVSDPVECVFSYGVWISGDSPGDEDIWVLLRGNEIRDTVFGVGYGHVSSGYLEENRFLGVRTPLYTAADYEFLVAGEPQEIPDPFPDATWIDLGGNVRPLERDWSDFETRCPALFE